jgi:hypothetical protein
MTVSVGPLGSAEDAYGIGRACTAHDRPDVEPLSLEGRRGRLAHPWPGQAVEHHLGLLGGDPASRRPAAASTFAHSTWRGSTRCSPTPGRTPTAIG